MPSERFELSRHKATGLKSVVPTNYTTRADWGTWGRTKANASRVRRAAITPFPNGDCYF